MLQKEWELSLIPLSELVPYITKSERKKKKKMMASEWGSHKINEKGNYYSSGFKWVLVITGIGCVPLYFALQFYFRYKKVLPE